LRPVTGLDSMETTEWWLKPFAWLFARRPDWRDSSGRVLLRMGNHFYIVLAIAFALAGAWDEFVSPLDKQLSDASFDWLMRHRPLAYKPDPDIVVLDIDEASLAALAPQYGRWPWPRQVLSDVAAKLEGSRAQAVMFDILFADPDVVNPDSELAFDRYVSASRNSFFAATRLNPKNDSVSQVTVSMLNFAERDPKIAPAQVNGQRTIALLPPYFKSIYDSTRTGTNNITTDADNEVRWYSNYETLGGYRIPSLPYRMAQVLGWPLPAQSRSLINWPKGATPYHTVSFADAYRAARNHDDAFFARFSGKVALIGSTAPGLNDVKATPVDHVHPGIYVLATVIDNTKNNRFLRPLEPAWLWGMELLMLAAAVRLFSRTDRAPAVAKYFVIIPGALLTISLLSVSVSDLVIDLYVPTALVLGYFSIATIFDTNSRAFASGTAPFAPTPGELAAGKLQVACLPASVPRHRVDAMLMRPGCPIKLWAPLKTGLGKHWNGQGWVVWRWFVHGSPDGGPIAPPAGAAEEFDLRWHDVPALGVQGSTFSLAHTIVAAAQDSAASAAVKQDNNRNRDEN
jgi:adenylate cyclase